MAGAQPGVHAVKLKPVQVPDSLSTPRKFIKWDDESPLAVPVTLALDPNGYILYWKDQNKEMDYLDVSIIRDTRTGRSARLPKDPRLREAINAGAAPDCPLEDRMVTVCYGIDMVNVSFINFAAPSRDVAKEWCDEIFRCATNLLALNHSPSHFLEKCFTKLSFIKDVDNKIPVRNIMKMFAQNKEDRKRVQKALEAAKLPSGPNDRIDTFSFNDFFTFYHNLCGRTEVDAVFHKIGSPQKPYLTAEQFMHFLNEEQRDPRLNEILYPYCDLKKAQSLIDQFEPNNKISQSAASNIPPGCLSKEGFLRYLLSPENSIIPPEKLDLNEDMTLPLSNYFINSSHNTYLTGHQLTGKSSVEIYRQALLTGCRCVELDCWDGKGVDEEPIITHGFTMCTYVSLKEVIEAIAETAFKVSDYPLILSFENHCSPKQQAKIALHCRNIFGEALLTETLEGYPLEPGVSIPSPELLKRKILVKNKKRHLHKCRSNVEAKIPKTTTEEDRPRPSLRPMVSNTSTVASDGEGAGKISEEEFAAWATCADASGEAVEGSDDSDSEIGDEPVLAEVEGSNTQEVINEKGTEGQEAEAGMEMSALVNYVQPARFHSFEIAEKRGRSYECTSFVETTATALLKAFPVDFVNFNKFQISRIYPKGTRVDSSNYMPQIFWNAGCQLVALNFQTLDISMQLNLGTFEYNGRSGYILKPDFMRRKDRQFDPFTESTVDGIVAGTVEVKIISGQFLTDRKVGTYVEVDMYGLPADTVRRKFRTKVYPANGINPIYDEEPFVFRKSDLSFTMMVGFMALPAPLNPPLNGPYIVVLPNLATIRIAVYHEGGTTLLGHRVLPIEGLRPGYRHICLRNECNQPQGIATLFVRISVKDYVPDAFADFAAALANPIAYQSSVEEHTEQLAKLEDFDEKHEEVSETDAVSATAVGQQRNVPPAPSNKKSGESPSAFTRLGSIVNRPVSTQENSPANLSCATDSSSQVGTSRSISVPSSPHHGGASSEKTAQPTRLIETELIESITLPELKQNKQLIKAVSKQGHELEALRHKNEKIRHARQQAHSVEQEKMATAHLKAKLALEKAHARHAVEELIAVRNQQEITNLIQDQEMQLQSMKSNHSDELLTLCLEQYQSELDLQLSHHSMTYGRLEQLLARHKETQVAKLNKIHDREVGDLKKKQDSQNWEEMKTLAKKYKDKNELARVRREAMQKYINMAVQERQTLKEILERRLSEIETMHGLVSEQINNDRKEIEDQLRRTFESRCKMAMVERSKSISNGSSMEPNTFPGQSSQPL